MKMKLCGQMVNYVCIFFQLVWIAQLSKFSFKNLTVTKQDTAQTLHNHESWVFWTMKFQHQKKDPYDVRIPIETKRKVIIHLYLWSSRTHQYWCYTTSRCWPRNPIWFWSHSQQSCLHRGKKKKANDHTYDLNPDRLWSSSTHSEMATSMSAKTAPPREV